MIAVTGNLTAIAENIEVQFGYNEDAVEPVTFAVLPNGAGGTITSDGLYTAPVLTSKKPKEFIDTIEITDANGDKATTTITVLPPIALLADIIKTEMGLAADQITIYNQKFNPPKDERVYVSVGILSEKVFGSSRSYDPTEVNSLKEIVSVNWRGLVSVEIYSSSNQALLRRHEIVTALNSTYSEQQQAANNFKLGRIPSNFINLSREEGPAIPYRFNISIGMLFTTKSIKEVAYYDSIPNHSININS